MTSNDDYERDELPVFSFKKEIISIIKDNQIVICIGETGSGKTTQIPQFCLDEGILGDGKIGITQPRRVAAIAMASRVSDERKSSVGGEVGYCIRFDDSTSSQTKIKYLTDGILVRECLFDNDLSGYSMIMLDEAHERSLNTDILFGLMKNVCKRRSDIRILITSATLDEQKFSSYFENAPIIRVPGRIFPVDIFHSKIRQVMTTSGPSNPSYVDDAVELALQINREEDSGHILIFLTGQNEIDRACERIEQSLTSRDNEMVVIPLYAALSGSAQQNIFKRYTTKDGKYARKCIVATNIAETSITVPNVRYVIDSGYVKQKTYDPTRHMESLIVVPISQVSAQQRAGRAGRTGPGKCYRLYSSDSYQSMMRETVPEILRTNLSNTLLYLKVLGINDVLAFDFLDRPSEAQALEALILLHQLEALDEFGQATALGRSISDLPLEPSLSRSIIESSKCDCLTEMASIAAMLSVESVWIEPPRRNKIRNANHQSYLEEIERAHSKLRHPIGDHLSYLTIFREFDRTGIHSKAWCEDNYINYRSMSTANRIRDQIIKDMGKFDRNVKIKQTVRDTSLTEDLVKNLTHCLLSGFFMNSVRSCSGTTSSLSALNNGRNTHMYRTLPIKKDDDVAMVFLHPSSTLSSFPIPHQYLIYQELSSIGGKTYIRHSTKIQDFELARFTSKWKEPVSSLILSGRNVSLAPNNTTDLKDNIPIREPTSIDIAAIENPLKRAISDTALDEAKSRYLARKMIKKK